VNRRILKVSAMVITATVIAAIAWFIYWPKRYDEGLNRIQNGDSIQTVQKFMGRNGGVESCGTMVDAPASCTEELVYSDPGARMLPQYWIIWFDASQHVVGKFHAISV
jgi:hypothetical protein